MFSVSFQRKLSASYISLWIVLHSISRRHVCFQKEQQLHLAHSGAGQYCCATDRVGSIADIVHVALVLPCPLLAIAIQHLPFRPVLLNCYHLFCMQVLNVPVHLRKKWEYLFLVVLAPWKPTSSSAALRMLVDELLLLHRGVDFLRADGVGGSLRAMMLMTVSDYRAHSIPASCSQHPGMYGCSKCRHRGRRAHGTTVYADYHRCGIR